MSKIITPESGLVSPEGPDVTITMTLDTKTMKTTLSANKQINRLVLVTVLQQHCLMLLQQVMADTVTNKPSGVVNAS